MNITGIRLFRLNVNRNTLAEEMNSSSKIKKAGITGL